MVKILVVDDEPDLLQLLIDDLADEGYSVISAEDGSAGLKQIYLHRPDVVLLDLAMPELSGYDVLRELRRDPTMKDLPVILLTVTDSAEAEKTVYEWGARHYMTKPWDLDHLQAVIRVAIRDAEISGWTIDDDQDGDQQEKSGPGLAASPYPAVQGLAQSIKRSICSQPRSRVETRQHRRPPHHRSS